MPPPVIFQKASYRRSCDLLSVTVIYGAARDWQTNCKPAENVGSIIRHIPFPNHYPGRGVARSQAQPVSGRT
jgi:hypothetical protein